MTLAGPFCFGPQFPLVEYEDDNVDPGAGDRQWKNQEEDPGCEPTLLRALLQDVLASTIPQLQVPERLREGGQPGALLRRYPHHQECARQPLLCCQCPLPGHCHRERGRWLLPGHPPGADSAHTVPTTWLASLCFHTCSCYTHWAPRDQGQCPPILLFQHPGFHQDTGPGSFRTKKRFETGRIEPNYPKVCGHQGNVLDIKWNPFIDNIIASCSEDTSVRIWEIPEGGLKRNMTEALLELHGHSRRVGLVEWHPTTNNILFSAGYDYKVLIWNLDVGEPVKMIDCHSDVILCMSFNTDGSLLTTTCKDKKLRVIEPRSGRVLQEANCKNHRVNRVVFLGNMKRLLTTGVSRWNTRQIALWDQEDLSMPLIEEEIDGLSGLLFPFYDADTHMLYLAGKGDGNIRYYEISTEKPFLSYLMEFRSPAPQKGLGVMPKHGLDVSACEVFRFYKLVTLKGLIEPISMIVPRRSDSYQEDIYPMTPGTEPALTPDEWLGGINRDPVLMSLKEGYKKSSKMVFKAPIKEKKSVVVNGIDLLENVPPRTENELLRMFFRQQDEIRRLKEELAQKDIRIRQLQLELKNLRNSPKNC
ncbi:coronin-2B isoform X1 [Panthera pardus]|nr:coronin-2B isoform X1 [Panthera pardus]